MRLYISLLNASWPMPRMLSAPNFAPRHVKLQALAVIVGGMAKAVPVRPTRTCEHLFTGLVSVLLVLRQDYKYLLPQSVDLYARHSYSYAASCECYKRFHSASRVFHDGSRALPVFDSTPRPTRILWRL
jgi:hypothetical protein